MAVEIKTLGSGNKGNGVLMDLYTVPDSPVPKSAVVTSVRLVNISATNPATVNLYVKESSSATSYRIAKKDYQITAGQMLLMEDSVALGKGDKVKVSVTGSSPTVDFMVSGMERDY